jgi:hypothetical protein
MVCGSKHEKKPILLICLTYIHRLTDRRAIPRQPCHLIFVGETTSPTNISHSASPTADCPTLCVNAAWARSPPTARAASAMPGSCAATAWAAYPWPAFCAATTPGLICYDRPPRPSPPHPALPTDWTRRLATVVGEEGKYFS